MTMKWGGWIILPLIILIYFSISRHYGEQESRLKLQLNREVAAAEYSVKNELDKINKIIPDLEKRLSAEQAETNGNLIQKQELATKISALVIRQNELNGQIDALNSTKSETRSKKRENLQDIKAIQRKIAGLQQDINKIKACLKTVTGL